MIERTFDLNLIDAPSAPVAQTPFRGPQDMDDQNDSAAPPRSFCWRSTPESRAAGTWSVLAVTETVLSVAAYWWIAVAFDTHLHLVVSILFAPFVLLRSKASIDLAVEMFEQYWAQSEEDQIKKSTVWLIALLAAACSGLMAWALAEYWLTGHTGWALFGRAGVLGLIAINVGFVAAGAGAGAVMGPVVAAALAMGILIRAFITRFWATATHFITGVRNFPRNWRRLMTQTDSFQPPDLIPGLPEGHALRFEKWIHRKNEKWDNKAFAAIIAPVLFLPSLLDRYSLNPLPGRIYR